MYELTEEFVKMETISELSKNEDSIETQELEDSGMQVPYEMEKEYNDEEDGKLAVTIGVKECKITLKLPRIPFPSSYTNYSYHCYHCDGQMEHNKEARTYTCKKCSYLEDLYKTTEHNAGLYLGFCPKCENMGPVLHLCYYCMRNIPRNSEVDKVKLLTTSLYSVSKKINPARRAELHNFIYFIKDNQTEIDIWKLARKNFYEEIFISWKVKFLPCKSHDEEKALQECRDCQNALQTWKEKPSRSNRKMVYEDIRYCSYLIR